MSGFASTRAGAAVRAGAACAALALGACGGGGLPMAQVTGPVEQSLRQTALGAVVGGAGLHGGHAWLGLPYAAPPVGALRWRAPQPATPWEGERMALRHPPACPQFSGLGGEPGELQGSEDCLYLNIFAPAFAPEALPQGEARLPVMLWIHGGGNTIGDAAFYDGSLLASEQGVILVAVQYRIGPFGWFRHAALRSGASPAEASGNFGLLDLLAALRWLRGNIAAFGGDPGNITVFGESAGGSNTFALLFSPLSQGLFQRAIVQSGSPRMLPGAAAESRRALAEARQQHGGAGLPENTSGPVAQRLLGAAANGPAEAVAAALRSANWRKVLGAYQGRRDLGMIAMPTLFADGFALPSEPALEALAAGRYRQMPVIIGSNRDEPKFFQVGDPALVRWLLGVPIGLRDPLRYDREAEYGAKWFKLSGVDEPARRMRAAQGGSVFAYRFDWDEEPKILWWDFSRIFGAAHAFEIPFLFGNFDMGRLTPALFNEENEAPRLELGRRMRSYWAEFARSGNPGSGGGDLPAWTAWDDSRPTAGRFMVFDTEAGGGVRMSSDALSAEGVLTQIAADPRFADSAERCESLTKLQLWWGGLSEADLRKGGCDPQPPQSAGN